MSNHDPVSPAGTAERLGVRQVVEARAHPVDRRDAKRPTAPLPSRRDEAATRWEILRHVSRLLGL
jgi:hypothetical protein